MSTRRRSGPHGSSISNATSQDAGAPMRILHIAGYSDSGKTHLVEALAQRLAGRVLVWKFSHHPPAPDRMGSDTQRFAAAKADTLLLQPGCATWRSADPPALDWEELAKRYAWVLWEGGKSLPSPKILLDSGPLLAHVQSVRAVIGPLAPDRSAICWLDCPLPLTDEGSVRACAFIMDRLPQLSFAWEEIHQNGWLAHPSI